MEWITDWARQIASYLIFTSFLTKLIRKPNDRKYLQLISGILLIFLLGEPLLLLFGQEGEYRFHLNRYLLTDEAAEEAMLQRLNGIREGMQQKELKTALEGRIKEIADSFGLELLQCEVELSLSETGYGRPKRIYMELLTDESRAQQFGVASPQAIRIRERIVREFEMDKDAVEILIR